MTTTEATKTVRLEMTEAEATVILAALESEKETLDDWTGADVSPDERPMPDADPEDAANWQRCVDVRQRLAMAVGCPGEALHRIVNDMFVDLRYVLCETAFTCTEAVAIADVMDMVGFDSSDFKKNHAYTDDEPSDRHHGGWGEPAAHTHFEVDR